MSAHTHAQQLLRWHRAWRPAKQATRPAPPLPCARHLACAAHGAGGGSVTIVGLGPGDPALLTRQALEVLTCAPLVHVRTATHPTLAQLGLLLRSYDEVYESEATLQEVYPKIVDDLCAAATQRGEHVVYAVPGDPCVAEMTVKLLRDRAAAGSFQVR
jgi:tetrapyrrole methylase family protein/MazG family protein